MRLLLILILTVSCAPKPSKLRFGVTTKSELIELKGEPLDETKFSQQSVEVLTFENDEKYQIKKDVVESSWRRPTEEEKSLLHWKYKYKNEAVDFKPYEDGKQKSHEDRTVQYLLDNKGLTIVYDPQIDQVVRVLEYAQTH
jgi:hypothetical protein